MFTVVIAGSYLLLLLISIFLDPKRKRAAKKFSIFQLLLFSTLKMLLVIGVVVAFAFIYKIDMPGTLGLSVLSVSRQSLGFGALTALGFIVIYVIWQLVALRFVAKREDTRDADSGIMGSLPSRWFPLVGVFAVISLQAGILEEIFFRGIMQSHISCYLEAHWAAVITGILFGVAHFYQGLSGIAGTSIMGVWLGLSFAFTGNILVPILGHVLGDFSCMMLGARSIVDRRKIKSDRDGDTHVGGV
ncbi:MAG: CPBP family intramembrane metalloprotease [candidate division WOR-3 bacterium]|nr:MAG: CPBP family intramembrane metalloprotease [candidate division WOR-3 bacterium]